ncbi:MAG: hypothetical protein KatS3mg129_1427 [Leptospiraceae bacterium]|nr:MAG: hypothetical protein KatS3mg129_1427 [Leptospiraceae bacterium]
MKYYYSLIIYFLFCFFLFPQNIYNKTIKKNELLRMQIDNYFQWIIQLPFDFQYKIFKEGIFWNYEGKNLGIEKFFLRTSAIENRKEISLNDWKKEFYLCKHPYKKIQINTIQNPALNTYILCKKDDFFIYKSSIFYNNTFYVIYIIWINNEEWNNNIINFINQIQYKITELK